MRANLPSRRPARPLARRCTPGIALALALTLAAPVPADAAGETVTVKLKPLSSAYPSITSTSIRIDLKFTGQHNGKRVKQAPLRIDLVDLSHQRERSFSLTGAAIDLIIPDPDLATLAIKQLAVYDFKGTQMVYMRGKQTVCLKQDSGDNLLQEMEDAFSPESLMGGAGMSEFKGRLVRTESVFGIPARRYAITDPADLGTYKRMDVWVAVRGSYLIKIDAVESVSPTATDGFVQNFDGDMQMTYAIFSVNKARSMKIPGECRNELSG